MAASDNMRPEQLKMFMSAREITDRFQPSDWDRDKIRDPEHGMRPETDEEVMYRKLTESKSYDFGNIHPSIAAEGVHTPVHLSHQFGEAQRRGAGPPSQGRPQIGEGHHRVAASMDTRSRPSDPGDAPREHGRSRQLHPRLRVIEGVSQCQGTHSEAIPSNSRCS